MKNPFLFVCVLIVSLFFSATAVHAGGYGNLASVRLTISPSDFSTLRTGKDYYLSALAYDEYGVPMHEGITYDWGISSDGSIGQIFSDQNGKIATLKVTGASQGDLYVVANDGQNQVVNSVSVMSYDRAVLCKADIDQSGFVDVTDYSIMVNYFLQFSPANPRADLNGDNFVDLIDYSILVRSFLQWCWSW